MTYDPALLAYAFALTLFAGLATGVGSLLAFLGKPGNPRFLSTALGFSAGVMIYVSMIEIVPKARDALSVDFGEVGGAWVTTVAFFAGIALIGVIDRLVPSAVNPHEFRHDDGSGSARSGSGDVVDEERLRRAKLLRTGVLTAIALAIHNFPEGFATFLSALQHPTLAISVAVAIAIHNIPEGIAVSLPIREATGSRARGFWYSFASGLAEPAGALIGFLLLAPILSEAVFGVAFAAVAGIMVFISLDELLPTAREYGEHHLSIYGLVAGMAVMALSLLLFL